MEQKPSGTPPPSEMVSYLETWCLKFQLDSYTFSPKLNFLPQYKCPQGVTLKLPGLSARAHFLLSFERSQQGRFLSLLESISESWEGLGKRRLPPTLSKYSFPALVQLALDVASIPHVNVT